jgi:hypothetical protein
MDRPRVRASILSDGHVQAVAREHLPFESNTAPAGRVSAKVQVRARAPLRGSGSESNLSTATYGRGPGAAGGRGLRIGPGRGLGQRPRCTRRLGGRGGSVCIPGRGGSAVHPGELETCTPPCRAAECLAPFASWTLLPLASWRSASGSWTRRRSGTIRSVSQSARVTERVQINNPLSRALAGPCGCREPRSASRVYSHSHIFGSWRVAGSRAAGYAVEAQEPAGRGPTGHLSLPAQGHSAAGNKPDGLVCVIQLYHGHFAPGWREPVQ